MLTEGVDSVCQMVDFWIYAAMFKKMHGYKVVCGVWHLIRYLC